MKPPDFRPGVADAAKAIGMARVDTAASLTWQIEMHIHAVGTARALRFFTSDDVYQRAYTAGMTATTHDQRAFGPVMMRLARDGLCRRANRPPVNSQRRTLHASPRTVWESLIYTPGLTDEATPGRKRKNGR